MSEDFDVIVVGAGMMGSAAARHLALGRARTALVGPPEPEDTAGHAGVFASHYDQARITRRIDADADWSRLATASIQRYGEIEQQAGVKFYKDVGCLMAGAGHGPGSDFLRDCAAVCDREDIPHERLSKQAIAARFPFFRFPDEVAGLFEAKEAGYVDPRAKVAAQKTAAERAGALIVEQEVTGVTETECGVEVACADGAVLKGGRVVLACGPFMNADGLLPEPVDLRVYARTIALLELGPEEVERLKDMPSLLYVSPDRTIDVYVLPPVVYPDGKTYIKLGGDPVDVALKTVGEMKAWFRSQGDIQVGRMLIEQLLSFMPGLHYRSVAFKSCATSYTPTGQPHIAHRSDRVIALCGGNGKAAKSSDEIGRIGAALALGDPGYAAGYGFDFKP